MKHKVLPILILIMSIIMSCCAEAGTTINIDKSQAVWLNLERAQDFCSEARNVDSGEVVRSPALVDAMHEYPSNTIFAVAVCFAAMVPDSELTNLSPTEKDAYIDDVFTNARSCCDDAEILVDFPLGTCYEYRFFYAYGTRGQIEKLTCGNDIALYIAATWQYK